MTANNKTTQDLHPKSTYEPQYPYNHVTVYDDGTEIHVDTTPGKERIRLAHGPSGTYTEVNADGRRVDMITNRHNHYVKGGYAFTIDGNVDEKIGGSKRSSVHGDSHGEVQGAASILTGGDKTEIVSGDHTTAVGGDTVHGVAGKGVFKFGGGFQCKIDGVTSDTTSAETICDAPVSVQCGQDFNMYVKGGYTLVVDGPITIQSGTSITLSVGETIIEVGPQQVNVYAEIVSVAKQTFIGQKNKGDTKGDLINTMGGPAIFAFALD